MKKLTITIILLVLIALAAILFGALSKRAFDINNDAASVAVVKGFIDEMIPHHQDAVDVSLRVMNDLEITDPQVRIFAANVVDEQTFEIAKMKNIYTEYFNAEYMMGANHMAKTVTAITADMKGDVLAKEYAKEMIKHHEMAVKMSKEYIEKIDNARERAGEDQNTLSTSTQAAITDSYNLAAEIIKAQKAEIEIMKAWK